MSPNNKGVNQACKKVVFILKHLQAAMQNNVAFENAVEFQKNSNMVFDVACRDTN
jgi:hypothetical protein